MDLEVDAQNKDGALREEGHDFIEPQGHKGGQRLHHDGRQPDAVDIPNDVSAGAKAPGREGEVLSSGHEKKAHSHPQKLSRHCGQRRARNAERGNGAASKDEKGVKDQVEHRADALDDPKGSPLASRMRSVANCMVIPTEQQVTMER